MANTAFEAITKRQAYYSAQKLDKYYGVQWSTSGRLELSDGSRPFAGVVEYGTDDAEQMATVVMGIYPCVAGEANLAANTLVTFSDGKVVKAASGTALGMTISAGTSVDDLVGVVLFDAPYSIT